MTIEYNGYPISTDNSTGRYTFSALCQNCDCILVAAKEFRPVRKIISAARGHERLMLKNGGSDHVITVTGWDAGPRDFTGDKRIIISTDLLPLDGSLGTSF